RRHSYSIACQERVRCKRARIWRSKASSNYSTSKAGLPPGHAPDFPWRRRNVQNSLQIDREVDARGLNCPLPILRTKKALNDMASGQVVRILATDPASVRDFQAFARQTGNELVAHGEQDGAFFFVMKRK